MSMLSVIVPCYNEEAVLKIFFSELRKVTDQMNDVSFEFIFVDDGSKDATLEIVKKFAEEDKRVIYVSFSRNYGKESAIFAGLETAKGDYVVLMDADMQDPPALLPEMYRVLVDEKLDCVGTRRTTRKGEPKIRSLFARMFYKLMKKISDVDIVDGARDYQILSRKAVNAILSMPERARFSKGIFVWIGFKRKYLEYENTERAAGDTKWSFFSLMKYAIHGILSFTTMPLIISSFLGAVLFLISLAAIAVIIVRKLYWGDPTTGWASTACLILMMGGLQLFCIGIMGQYLAKMYTEIKRRPIYLVDETNREE